MNADSVTVRISGGVLSFIYADDLAPLLTAGPSTVRRVSHVEPSPFGGWAADMSPVGGPVLGPWPLRQQALDGEREWLREHKGL